MHQLSGGALHSSSWHAREARAPVRAERGGGRSGKWEGAELLVEARSEKARRFSGGILVARESTLSLVALNCELETLICLPLRSMAPPCRITQAFFNMAYVLAASGGGTTGDTCVLQRLFHGTRRSQT